MSNEKPPDTAIELEKLEQVESEKNNEPLEKVKLKAPPGINASLVLFYAIFFFMFVIGWVNLNNCTVSRLIPIYLIVAGFVGALTKSISGTTNKHLFNVVIVLGLFYLVWHCLGVYWVYKEYQPNYDENSEEKYCNRTTYLLAFWILTLQHTVLLFILVLYGCIKLTKGDFK